MAEPDFFGALDDAFTAPAGGAATYQRAEKLGTVGFDYELANLQGMRGDFEGMVGAYMSLLVTKPNYLRTVQNSLNRNLRK